MHYLFETQHFLFRKRIPEDAGRLPAAFPEEALILCHPEQGTGHHRDMPETLIIEFRSTGAPAGEVFIRSSADSPEGVEVRCRLSRGFCQKSFQAEIVDAVNLLFGCSSAGTSLCTDGHLPDNQSPLSEKQLPLPGKVPQITSMERVSARTIVSSGILGISSLFLTCSGR